MSLHGLGIVPEIILIKCVFWALDSEPSTSDGELFSLFTLVFYLARCFLLMACGQSFDSGGEI